MNFSGLPNEVIIQIIDKLPSIYTRIFLHSPDLRLLIIENYFKDITFWRERN